jgi:hypothetical protein
MFKTAMKGNETGLISGEHFGGFIKSLGVQEDFIAQLLFGMHFSFLYTFCLLFSGVFDKDGDGLVDFKELLVTLRYSQLKC